MIGGWLLMALAGAAGEPALSVSPMALSEEHRRRRFVTVAAPCLTPERLGDEIARLSAAHPGVVRVETVGVSFHGRDIRLLSVGRGPKSILLWSQMHGDEPSATPALLDLADYLAREAGTPDVARILDAFTLRLIPMLNPDGALVYERRNAQGIDINRDALMLTTPEGRLLKAVRERFSPLLGFNLHDQSRRITVGDTGVLSTISLLAVAGDAQGTLTPGRLRARRVASRIVKTLSPFIPGGIARYDEDWNPRAFGDNITAWGTPVVLIESGGFPQGGGFEDLTRLNFVALVSILDALARNDLEDESPALYDALLRNKADAWADLAIAGASILDPKSGRWFAADLAWDILRSDRTLAGCGTPARTGSRVVEVGDSRVVTPGRRIEGRGMALAPLPRDPDLKPGPIRREALMEWRKTETSGDRPQELLQALAASAEPLARNGRATFVAWMPGGANEPGGRYFIVVDGVGLPDPGN